MKTMKMTKPLIALTFSSILLLSGCGDKDNNISGRGLVQTQERLNIDINSSDNLLSPFGPSFEQTRRRRSFVEMTGQAQISGRNSTPGGQRSVVISPQSRNRRDREVSPLPRRRGRSSNPRRERIQSSEGSQIFIPARGNMRGNTRRSIRGNRRNTPMISLRPGTYKLSVSVWRDTRDSGRRSLKLRGKLQTFDLQTGRRNSEKGKRFHGEIAEGQWSVLTQEFTVSTGFTQGRVILTIQNNQNTIFIDDIILTQIK